MTWTACVKNWKGISDDNRKKGVIYARVSTLGQKSSLTHQIEMLTEYANKNGVQINADINAACNIMVCGCVKGKCNKSKCDVSVMRPACKRFVLNPVRVRL